MTINDKKKTDLLPKWYLKMELPNHIFFSLLLLVPEYESPVLTFCCVGSANPVDFLICAQLCPTLFDPMDCSQPGSSLHGISQARILEWVAISSSRGSSRSRDQTSISYISCIGKWILYHWANLEDHTEHSFSMLN